MNSRSSVHALLLVVAFLFALPLAAQSTGSCFDCPLNGDPEPPMTTDYDCLSISSGSFGSCSERITGYDEDGNISSDACVTYEATYCPAPTNPGGGDDSGGTGGGGEDNEDDECNSGGWGACPAQCSVCV